jgi:hypothetical protein
VGDSGEAIAGGGRGATHKKPGWPLVFIEALCDERCTCRYRIEPSWPNCSCVERGAV